VQLAGTGGSEAINANANGSEVVVTANTTPIRTLSPRATSGVNGERALTSQSLPEVSEKAVLLSESAQMYYMRCREKS